VSRDQPANALGAARHAGTTGRCDPPQLSGIAAARRVRADGEGTRAAADHPRDAEVRSRLDASRSGEGPRPRGTEVKVERRIAIVGTGRLGESLLRGFLSSGWRTADDLVVTARRPERRAELSERYGVSAVESNAEAVAAARLAIVAVKPQDVDTVLAEIAPSVTSEHTLLSVAAGV